LQHVLVQSEPLPQGTPEVQGYDFDGGSDLDGLMASMLYSGFQATQLGRAVDLVNKMVRFLNKGHQGGRGECCCTISNKPKGVP
jgi:deoxyhypusine synthase